MDIRQTVRCLGLPVAFVLLGLAVPGCQGQPGIKDEPTLAEARRLQSTGQHGEAVIVIRRFLSDQPSSQYRSDALLLAGECEMVTGDYSQAQRDFQEAQVKPRNSSVSARAKFGMGQAAFARDQYGDASRAYEAALRTGKNDIPAAKALYKLGLAYIRNHNWVEGRRRLRHLTEQYPNADEVEWARDVLSMSHDAFGLKCGSFATAAALKRRMRKLRELGLTPTVVSITRDGAVLKSIQVGTYDMFSEARVACDALRAKGVNCFIFP